MEEQQRLEKDKLKGGHTLEAGGPYAVAPWYVLHRDIRPDGVPRIANNIAVCPRGQSFTGFSASLLTWPPTSSE